MRVGSKCLDFELINKIIGTPWNPKGAGLSDHGEVEVIPVDRTLDLGHLEQPKHWRPERIPPEVCIRREHLVKYGHNSGCMKCR